MASSTLGRIIGWYMWSVVAVGTQTATAGTARDPGKPEIGGHVQSIVMHRDLTDIGKSSGSNASLGVEMKAGTPAGTLLDARLRYNAVLEPWKDGRSGINCNEDAQVLTEAWLGGRWQPGLSIGVGRRVLDGEIFRADPFRQKPRSLEGVVVECDGLPGWQVAAGHAIRMSNWIQDRDRADFNDFGDVFGAGRDTDGVSWIEGVFNGCPEWELALFDAYADGVANLCGSRVRWRCVDDRALLATVRHEQDVGRGGGDADAFGLAVEQQLGTLTLECGSFSVRGNNLAFQEVTTGLNHALGSLMLICDNPFSAGADSGYLRAVHTSRATTLYGLYAYTHHHDLPFDGHEINMVAKQQLSERLSVAVKLGVGLRQPDAGGDQWLTDSRLFVTCLF